MPILHDGVPEIAQSGSLPRAFLVQPSIRIGAALVARVRALLAMEVHPAIGRVPTRVPWIGRRFILGTEALQAGRGFDQRAIHREVLIAQQVQPIGLQHHLVEELATHVRVQQAVAVPGERGVVETGFDHIHIQKPAEAQVVVECLAEGAQKARSLRTENRLISKLAFSSRSGGIDGRPVPSAAYSASNCGESSANAASANCLIVRSGCLAGIRLSGSMNASMLVWGFVRPRTPPHYFPTTVDRKTFVNNLLSLSMRLGHLAQ